MKQLGEIFQTADWKTEKHVPVIDCAAKVKAGENFPVKVTLGKEIAHPNTTEHHIRWIDVYFQGEGDKFPCQIGHFEFTAHGESTEGPNKGSVFTHHEVSLTMKTGKSGTVYAASLCNIHGLWQSAREIKV
ncbi:MAG TPA: class II SORL domain-containing protein [Dehalococcoidales bacterium]|nr:MAG: Neelaredoxin [Chloroflexi bacterium RBG_16_60_22]HJX12854.1 class II SORL domain-containing protein [Dehalococcoidales bacterium]